MISATHFNFSFFDIHAIDLAAFDFLQFVCFVALLFAMLIISRHCFSALQRQRKQIRQKKCSAIALIFMKKYAHYLNWSVIIVIIYIINGWISFEHALIMISALLY